MPKNGKKRMKMNQDIIFLCNVVLINNPFKAPSLHQLTDIICTKILCKYT